MKKKKGKNVETSISSSDSEDTNVEMTNAPIAKKEESSPKRSTASSPLLLLRQAAPTAMTMTRRRP
jgi:hypothetical protein